MFNLENVTNTRGGGALQLEDLKVFANNRIKLGVDAREKIGLKEGRLVLIQKDKTSGKLYIASVDTEAGIGRPVNEEGQFSHSTIAHLLGGQHSEWAIEGEGTEFQGVTYFELVQKVNGADVKKELAEVAGEIEQPERAEVTLEEESVEEVEEAQEEVEEVEEEEEA